MINCAQLLSVELREGCENCDHGYSLDSNRQCSEFQIFTEYVQFVKLHSFAAAVLLDQGLTVFS